MPEHDSRVPFGSTATAVGAVVLDRATGAVTERVAADLPFRSASVVKILLALDHLWERGPLDELPAAEHSRLTDMLRRSHDGAASHYWARNGGSAIVARMAARLGLTGTAPPPASHPGFWGYTALTAADTVRLYRHLLEDTPAPVRDLVMGALRTAPRTAADGYDQYFGIPSAFARPWSLKQGWSGFDAPCGPADREASGACGIDLVGGVLHSTGTVGADDRAVVALLTLHPEGTPYPDACAEVDRLAAGLRVPGAVHAGP
ncbi:hypothetical protein [Streptomyces sp. TR06-5]|uniref:hypothetical protein n=1 Tax=unclassified Streptomyces TaxID=2593676 RepID=UPI0039A08061